MDLSVHPATVDSEIVNESWVAVNSEIINVTDSTADAWIRQRTQLLLTQKSSTKTVSLLIQKSTAIVESFFALPFSFLLGDYKGCVHAIQAMREGMFGCQIVAFKAAFESSWWPFHP